MLSDDEQPLGRLELHYAQSLTYGLLVLESEPVAAALRDLIVRIDEDLVCTAGTARHDFVLTVYAGRELAIYDDARRVSEGWTGQRDG